MKRQKNNFITIIYKDSTPTQTTRNLDTALAILSVSYKNIKIINWNWVRFTCEELAKAMNSSWK